MQKDSKLENKSKLAQEFADLIASGAKLDNAATVILLNRILQNS